MQVAVTYLQLSYAHMVIQNQPFPLCRHAGRITQLNELAATKPASSAFWETVDPTVVPNVPYFKLRGCWCSFTLIKLPVSSPH